MSLILYSEIFIEILLISKYISNNLLTYIQTIALRRSKYFPPQTFDLPNIHKF